MSKLKTAVWLVLWPVRVVGLVGCGLKTLDIGGQAIKGTWGMSWR